MNNIGVCFKIKWNLVSSVLEHTTKHRAIEGKT